MIRWFVYGLLVAVLSGCATISIPPPPSAPTPGENFKPLIMSVTNVQPTIISTNVPVMVSTNDFKKPDPGWVLDEFYASGNSAIFIWRHVRTGHRYFCSGFGGTIMVLE